MDAATRTIRPLDDHDAPLDLVGGKVRSLARLAAAGFPVPEGFVVSTEAYRSFVAANGLEPVILAIVAGAAGGETDSVDRAASSIASIFSTATIPADVAASIKGAYRQLGDGGSGVAVRSSATAEDLPNLSFAGQQETFLNVRGESALLEAVRRCWASLWTERAIGYRERMGVAHSGAAMAVIVQAMVPADVSGILFTANPTTGDREIIVNASFGLGEAIVGGHVTPDTYVVDRDNLALKETLIGEKESMIVSAPEQGTAACEVPAEKRGSSSLSESALHSLASLGLRIEQRFDGTPQDIEWAWAAAQCWVLQSRPITNLPPPPLTDVRWDPPRKGEKLVRRQVVEHMPDPLSPLFADLYLNDGWDKAMEYMIRIFRLPRGIEDIVERPYIVTVNGYAYTRASYRISPWLLVKAIAWYIVSLRRLLRTMIPRWRDEALPAYLKIIERWKSVDVQSASDQKLLTGIRALSVADAIYWLDVSIVLGGAKVTDALLDRFLRSRAVKGDLTSGRFLSGFSSSTLQAQKDLEAAGRRARGLADVRDLIEVTSAEDLLDELSRHENAGQVVEDIQRYLERYGHQIFSLDFVEPTLADEPLPVLLSFKALVQGTEHDAGGRETGVAAERDALIERTAQSLGPIRRWLFRKLLRWAQNYGPYREEALFFVGAAWPTLRRFALELGRRLTEAGTLVAPEDVFYLDSSELEEACVARGDRKALPAFQEIVRARRELRESQKRLHPPGMIPEKSKFKLGPFDISGFASQKRNVDDSDTLKGFAVSPGRVTAAATVILSPADFKNMQPDTILVCPTTTPAWTPLFGQASGLVTDIGGILSHGSIVAREYGIPAVMGTGNLSRRIVSGQRITVDGDAGTVTILS